MGGIGDVGGLGISPGMLLAARVGAGIMWVVVGAGLDGLGGVSGFSLAGAGQACESPRVPEVEFFKILLKGLYPTGCGTDLATAGGIVPVCIVCRFNLCSAWVSWLSPSCTCRLCWW